MAVCASKAGAGSWVEPAATVGGGEEKMAVGTTEAAREVELRAGANPVVAAWVVVA